MRCASGRRSRRELFDRLPNLRLLVTTGMRNAAVDLEAAAAHGVTVCGTEVPQHADRRARLGADPRARPAHPRRGCAACARAAGRPRSASISPARRSASSGSAGSARSSRATAPPSACDVIAWSQNLTAERAAESGAELVTKDELFASADVVTIHLVLSRRTRGLIGAHELGADEADRVPRQHLARPDRRRGRAARRARVGRDRRRRHRRLRPRAAAGRPSAATARRTRC